MRAVVPSANHLERFLEAVQAVRSTAAGVPETSYYPAIARLLEEVGGEPRSSGRAVIHIRDQGDGIPDGGLFVVRPNGPVYATDANWEQSRRR